MINILKINIRKLKNNNDFFGVIPKARTAKIVRK
jgi:hypothetical protein